MSLREKLNGIQTELKAGKDKNNDYGGFMYRSCESILEALKPLMAKYKVVVRLQDEICMVGDRFYIQAYAILEDVESDESITTTAWAREPQSKKGMDESQVTGASSSYARKYALCGMFAIDDNKDSDDTNKGQEDEKQEAPKPTEHLAEVMHERQLMLDDIEFAKGEDYIPKLLTHLNKQKVDEIPTDYLKKVWLRFCNTSEART